MPGKFSRDELFRQFSELALCQCNDVVKLAFLDREDALNAINQDKLDLRCLASLHIAANGNIELKFLDRTKLIELLLSAAEDSSDSTASSLIAALNNAAKTSPTEVNHDLP